MANLHLSNRIQRKGLLTETNALYLNLASTVHEKMKRRGLKVIKSAIRGLTRTLLYAAGFMFG
jgi:hypothetical protein